MRALTAEQAAKLIEAAGAQCLGVKLDAVWLTDPVTQTTLALPLEGLTLRRLTAELHRSRKQFLLARRRAARQEAAQAPRHVAPI